MKKLSPAGRFRVHAAAWLAVLVSCVFAGYAFAGRDRLPSGGATASETLTPGPLNVGASGIATDGGVNLCNAAGGADCAKLTGGSGGVAVETGYLWVKSGSGVFFNALGTRRIYDNNSKISVNGTLQSESGSGTDAFSVLTSGARWHIGAGASDYLSSDGTTVTAAGPLASASTITALLSYVQSTATGAAATAFYASGATSGAFQAASTMKCLGGPSDGASAVAVSSDAANALSTAGAKIHSFRNAGTEKSSIDLNGNFQNLGTIGTAASGTGITANYSGVQRTWLHKVTVINTALAAAATSDVTLHVTPVNTRITRVVADVTQVFTGGALSAMTITCGNSAGGNQYLLSNSVFTAQNTWGDVVAEMGAGVVSATLADFGTVAAGVPGAITVQCRFTCTGANCSAATQGSVTFYVEGVTYP